jgi:polysaccharide deacetylase family protein (PEP-CTERM system associated)
VSSTADIIHFFTVDVEEYFHANAFDRVISRQTWSAWPRRLDRTLPRLLALLEEHGTHGTFFVLGWVAEQMPQLVRQIADAGHEVACHGHWHRRVPTLTPDEFREDIRTAKVTLEQVTGRPVLGFRAPSFSILRGYEWTFDVLIDEGFTYDSSLFPVWRRGYGYPGSPRWPHVIQRPAGRLAEFPLATTRFVGVTLPAAGGGYLRHFPFGLIRRAFREASARGMPATFYTHPWEIDVTQPRVQVSLLTRARHYRGLSQTLPRIERLLSEFPFTTIASGLNQIPTSSPEGRIDS